VLATGGYPQPHNGFSLADQDTNCRFVGRCVHGAILDREIGHMIARDADGKRIPLNQDLDRRFLYACYNADLSREGLDAMDLNDIQSKNVQKLDSIEYIDDLRRVSRKVAQETKIEHFGNFTS
jgi:hypothetical protein